MSKWIAGIVLAFSSILYQSGIAETITVMQAVKNAFSVHPSMAVARAGYNQALGQRLIELSPDPASIALEYEGVPDGESMDAHEARTFSLSQEFAFPLKYVWRARAAGIAVDEARINALIQMLDLEQEVRNAYVQAWLIDQQLKILDENANAAETYARQLKRLVELGESAPLEERRARVEALQASTKRDAVIKERIAVWGKFQSLTGIDTAGIVLNPPLAFDSSKAFPLGAVFNPDESFELKSALLQSTLANVETKAAVFSWLPDLELSYFQQNVPSETDPDFWGVEFGISLPVWFWLSGRGEIQTAKANQRAARGNLENLRLQQQTKAVALIQSQQALWNKLELYDEQVHPLAEEAYKLAMKSYNTGEASYLEVIDSQRTLLDIQLEHVEINAALADVMSEIDRIKGRSVIGFDELQDILNRGY
ncbi:TolC family protein [bacterium]|nr:TolC family protein [bacterium]